MSRREIAEVPADPWESDDLGCDEKHVRKSPVDREQAVEETLELQLISIRLQKALIEELKFIAKYHGVGYQPLVRDVLGRFARAEISHIANQMRKKLEAQETIEGALRKGHSLKKEERSRKRA